MSLAAGSLLEAWWAHATRASVECACFALGALVIDLFLVRRSVPELRTALWLGVLAKLLFPGALLAPVSWSVPDSVLPASLVGSLSGANGAGAASSWLPAAAFCLWISGVTVFAAVGVARYRRLRRQRLAESDPAPQMVLRLGADVAARLGLRKRLPVRVFPGTESAVVLGFWRPVVLVPQSLLAPQRREELELVLYHELAHVRRRDPQWSLLCLAVQVLHWFHPLVWLVRRRLSCLRELGCDQTVGRALGGDTRSYRRALLTLAGPMAPRATGEGLAFLRPRSQLLTRLRSLERPIPSRPLLRQACALSLFAFLLACSLPEPRELPVPFAHEIPPLEDMEGCLRLRYAVQAMRFHASTVEGSELAPLLAQSTNR